MSDKTQAKKTSIGGQALIEGIMMRGPERTAMAVRNPEGQIVLESWPTQGQNKPKVCKIPFVRGIFNMVDSLRFGYKCLMRSAELAGLEENEKSAEKSDKRMEAVDTVPSLMDGAAACEAEAASRDSAAQARAGFARDTVSESVDCCGETENEAVTENIDDAQLSVDAEIVAEQVESTLTDTAAARIDVSPTQERPQGKEKTGEKFLMSLLMVFSVILGVAISVGLFIWLPSFLSGLLAETFPVMENWALKSVFEGVLRIILFVGYILLVSLMQDIRRVFMYHGAEHKAIFCYEKGEALTVENVRRQIRFHPRCGTSFMILVLIVGIVISMFIHISNPWLRTGVKLLTIPIVVGVGYELIKLAGRRDNLVTRIISAPGLWLQRVTTREPDDGMIECAIEALTDVIPEDPEADNW